MSDAIINQRPFEIRMVELVLPNDANHYGTLFGGRALSLMDMAAFLCATRHCRMNVVTASSDNIDFKVPVKVGMAVEVVGTLVKVGRSSMTVFVEMFAENLLTGERKLCTSGNFVMVATGLDGKPIPVPPLLEERRPGISG